MMSISLLGGFSRRRFAVAVVVLAASVLPACTPGQKLFDNTYNTDGKQPTPAPGPSSFVYRYPDQAPVVDAAGLQDFVGKYRHRVVLLDFWASWSRENRDELRYLVKMQNELRDDGLQVIACNMDAGERWAAEIVPMLHGAGGNFPCVVVPESQRPTLRAWLSPAWTYDLPARFIIDRTGRVSASVIGTTPQALEQQVRQVVRNSPGAGESAKLAAEEVGIRIKLIDVSSGKSGSLGEVIGPASDARRLAERAAERIAQKVDRSRNPRIAVAAFSAPGRPATNSGKTLAAGLVSALRDKGYYDLVEPTRTGRLISDAGQTPMTIEYDPSVIEGRIGADFLVLGWLRGATNDIGQARRATLAGHPSEAPDGETPLRSDQGNP